MEGVAAACPGRAEAARRIAHLKDRRAVAVHPAVTPGGKASAFGANEAMDISPKLRSHK
jgi:hypothetical protein